MRLGNRSPRAVLLLGVNEFKDVNSAFGHGIGDRVLRHLGARLSSRLSPGWSLARTAGDVFAVMAPLRAPATVEDCVRRVATVLDQPFAVGGGVRVQLSGTIGVAVTTGAAQPAHVLRDAEIAMYRAKSAGHQWALFDAAADGRAADRLQRVAELREGIDHRQMEVHYQPVVDLVSGEVTSVEALVRWRHPRRGLVQPMDFVGLAEQSGLIGGLTEVVLEAVGEQARVWAQAGRSLPCAVNLSLGCLVDPDVAGRLVDALESLRGAVTVEVTESVLADERAVMVLKRLAAAGVPCAIDDFGTGFSSLASLKNLPVTTVKIDRAFVKDLDRDDRDLALVRAMVQMTRALGLDVIAEGVENERAAAALRSVRVRHGQGYWFARPMPAAELDAWLTTRASLASDASHTLHGGPQSLGSAAQTATPRSTWSATGVEVARNDHVAVDGDRNNLQPQVETYASECLRGQGRFVVIATAERSKQVLSALPSHRRDQAEREGRLVVLDAEQALARFIRAGLPDAALFDSSIGDLVRGSMKQAGPLTVYSEMVAVLWDQGNSLAALELEDLWDALQRNNTFTLVCATPMAENVTGGQGRAAQISRPHTLVPPVPPHDAVTEVESLWVLLDSTRALLRVTTVAQAVEVLTRSVSALGGTTVPAAMALGDAIPIDISLGESEPLLASAPPHGRARVNLELHLPALVEDAKAAADRATQIARLYREVGTDPLTGLGNRRGLFRGRRVWLQTDSIAVLRLDDLTRIGETEGHECRDRLLVAFARALQQNLRDGDLAYRLGADEFVLVLPRTTPQEVLVALDTVRSKWATERPLLVTFSAGVAGVDEAGLSAALICAGAALHSASQGGRDRVALSGAARLAVSGNPSGTVSGARSTAMAQGQ